MELLSAVAEWALAVLEHWHGYVSGGVFAFGLELIKRFRDWEPSKRVFAVIVALGFLGSIFSAWNDEHRAKLSAEHKLEDLTKPKFEVTAGTSIVANPILDNGVMQTRATLVITPIIVFNHGAPSIIRDIRMSIHFKGGKELHGQLYLPKNEEITLLGPEGPVSFPRSSSIIFATRTPIPLGGQADGFASFQFVGDLVKEIRENAELLTFEVLDINDAIYKLQLPRTGIPATNFYMTPGMLEKR